MRSTRIMRHPVSHLAIFIKSQQRISRPSLPEVLTNPGHACRKVGDEIPRNSLVKDSVSGLLRTERTSLISKNHLATLRHTVNGFKVALRALRGSGRTGTDPRKLEPRTGKLHTASRKAYPVCLPLLCKGHVTCAAFYLLQNSP
jgi:hypothetical protein